MSYAIIAGDPDDEFRIRKGNGLVLTKTVLDYEAATEYNLTIKAYDSGEDSLSSLTSLIISVIDRNVRGEREGPKMPLTTTRLSSLAFKNVHTLLFLSALCIREWVSGWVGNALTLHYAALVALVWLQDNSPVFVPESGYEKLVAFENATVGQELLTVNATDDDSDDNGRLNFTMLGPDHELSDYFEVNGTGECIWQQCVQRCVHARIFFFYS